MGPDHGWYYKYFPNPESSRERLLLHWGNLCATVCTRYVFPFGQIAPLCHFQLGEQCIGLPGCLDPQAGEWTEHFGSGK